jgi:uncharacterized protein YerC
MSLDSRIQAIEENQNEVQKTLEALRDEIKPLLPVQTEVESRVFKQCLEYGLDRYAVVASTL